MYFLNLVILSHKQRARTSLAFFIIISIDYILDFFILYADYGVIFHALLLYVLYLITSKLFPNKLYTFNIILTHYVFVNLIYSIILNY